MINTIYVAGFICYCFSAALSYSKLKTSPYFFVIGLTMALVVNVLWLYVAKHTENNAELLVRGLIWDAVITICFLFVPIVFFGVRLTGPALYGAVLILLGIALTKIPS